MRDDYTNTSSLIQYLFDLCFIPVLDKMMNTNPASTLVLSLLVLAMAQLPFSEAQNSPEDFLAPHNAARAAVGVGPLSWDSNLEAYARNYANIRSNDCQLIHSGGPYGENIVGGQGENINAATSVELWVSEKFDYDYNSNTCLNGKECRHYTQVVWRNSARLGCARVRCSNYDNPAAFVICSYDPPGNYAHQKPY